MSNTLDVPKRQGSPTTIRSSGCEAPSYQNWPLYDQQNAHFVSPSDHYFKQSRFQAYDAPFDFDGHGYVDEKSEYYEHFPAELPEKPPRPFFRSIPFIPGYEIPIRPQIRRARRHIKNPIPLSWRSGFRRLYASWVENWWLWELLSWTVSAVCMGIIALILLLSDDRPVPSQDITLNSIISVLSGVAKAALLVPVAEALGQLKWSWFWRDTKKVEDFETFDMASRGPWGSLVLLWRTKGRTVATFGALIVIVSIALDPFFQQLVLFQQRWVPAAVNGTTIPQAVNYTGTFNGVHRQGIELSVPDAVMEGFLQPMIFGDEVDPEIPLRCPTSNCTWEPYDTLSICSTCADVSDLLSYACIDDTEVDWLSNATDPTNSTTLPRSKTCGYYLNATSEDPMLMTGYIPTLDPEQAGLEVLIGRVFPLFDMSILVAGDKFKTWYDGSINFRNLSNPLLDFLVINTAGGAPGVYANETPSAQECALSWCVKSFRSQYYVGSLNQTMVSPPLQPEGPSTFPWAVDESGLFYWPKFNYTPPGRNITFGVSNVTSFQVISLLGTYFPLTITSTGVYNDFKYRFSALQSTPWVKSLNKNAWVDVVARVDGIARLMTNVIMTSFEGMNSVTGTAWGNEVFVNVRWKWFSLPFALLLLSLMFLLATIFKSHDEEQEVGIWKTSALPVLINGLRGDVRRKMGDSRNMADVRERAKQVDMKLQNNGKGHRLSGMPASVWTSSPEQASRAWL